eukprot:2610456-Amphidinium_carterae.1
MIIIHNITINLINQNLIIAQGFSLRPYSLNGISVIRSRLDDSSEVMMPSSQVACQNAVAPSLMQSIHSPSSSVNARRSAKCAPLRSLLIFVNGSHERNYAKRQTKQELGS